MGQWFIDFLATTGGVAIITAAAGALGAAAKTLWDRISNRREREFDYAKQTKESLRDDIKYLTKTVNNLQGRVSKLEASLALSNRKYQQLYNRYIKLVYMHNALVTTLLTEGDDLTVDLVNRVLTAYGETVDSFDPSTDPLNKDDDSLFLSATPNTWDNATKDKRSVD